jgi:hypothetical protein
LLGVSSAKALIIWDFYFDTSYGANAGGITTYKAFQIRRAPNNIWYEPKTAYMGVDGKSGWAHIRGYNTTGYPMMVPPASIGTQTLLGKNYPDNLRPQLAEFPIEPRIWTRYFLEFTFTAGSTVLTNNMWMADETREAVQLYSNIQINIPPKTAGTTDGFLKFLQIEFNSSQSRGAAAPPWIGYIRNALALKDADTAFWLRKPVRGVA